MRITADEKAATRKRILTAAKALFRTKGFDAATTRDIAKDVGMATGTLFNYFTSKEAIVVELAAHSLEKAHADFTKNLRKGVKLDEELFALVAAQLRCMRSLRKFVRPLLDTALTPVANPKADEPAAELRANLAEQFVNVLARHGNDEPSPVAMNIFWALYVGVLTHWSHDTSPRQEDTLALLDQSMQMFVGWSE